MRSNPLQSSRHSIPCLVVCCKSVRIALAISLTFLYSTTLLWQLTQQQDPTSLHQTNNNHQTSPTEWHLRSFQQKIFKKYTSSLTRKSTRPPSLHQVLEQHQRNCSLGVAEFRFRNRYGMGSDLHLWAQALCNALQESVRIWTATPWIFRDEQVCGRKDSERESRKVVNASSEPLFTEDPLVSSMECYFPGSEATGCPVDTNAASRRKLYSGKGRIQHTCQPWLDQHNVTYSQFNQAALQYLYTRLSPMIQKTAQPWIQELFGSNEIPPSLITVHVRWGDKSREMKIVEINEYIQAVQQLVLQRGQQDDSHSDHLTEDSVHVYLATEDPAAVQAFKHEMPSRWKLYVDPSLAVEEAHRINATNGHARQAYLQEGRPGLHALTSLWIGLQARDFVLTTASNWSRLINEWRLASSKETRMIDLRPYDVVE